jgi:dihydrofolate reductase
MPDTTCHMSMSMSLDGFVAGPDQSRQDPLGKRGRELHGWHIGDPRANEADKAANEWLMRPRGAYVMGRNMFGPIRGTGVRNGPGGGALNRRITLRCSC